jgi:hypothetical protein
MADTLKVKYLGDDKPTDGSYNGVSFSIKDGVATLPTETARDMVNHSPALWEIEGEPRPKKGPKPSAKATMAGVDDKQRELHRQIAQEEVRPGYAAIPRDAKPKEIEKALDAQAKADPDVRAQVAAQKEGDK